MSTRWLSAFGRLGGATLACMVCLVALACGSADGELPEATTPESKTTTNIPSNDRAPTTTAANPTNTRSATTTSAPTATTDTTTTTTPATAAATPDTTTTAGIATTTNTATTLPPNTSTGSDTKPTTTLTTTTLTAPTTSAAAAVENPVSPWPQDPRTATDRNWGVQIVSRWHHDNNAFTQGLETHDGIIYESTGLYGNSRLRALDGADELRSVALDEELFGEGLTLIDDEIIQLTWRAGRALRWDRDTFAPLGEFSYEGEGWGICWDDMNSRLLMSDGTSTLTHRNRVDFSVLSTSTVRRGNEEVKQINELECVDGLVVANIWMQNEIIIFDPDTGEVLVSIDAAPLAAEAGIAATETHAVLNGIAYRGDGTWIIGGKNWPLQFLVTLTLG